jgi:hypothetical protein
MSTGSGVATRYTDEEIMDQIAQCYEYRLKGYSYARISQALSISTATVGTRIQTYLAAKPAVMAEAYRAECIDRSEYLYSKAMEVLANAKTPEQRLKAIDVAAKRNAEIYEYVGLKSIQVDSRHTVVNADTQELHQILKAARTKAINAGRVEAGLPELEVLEGEFTLDRDE